MREPYAGLLVLNRRTVRTYTAAVPYAVISITDPEKPDADLKASPWLRATLRLQFHDVHRAHRRRRVMTSEHARQIVDFAQQWRPQVELFVVHCEAGVSRSAGIATALAQWWCGDSRYFIDRFLPNIYVRDLVLNAAREQSADVVL